MAMTIEVYRVNPQTGARTVVRPLRTVEPADVPEVGQKYPPCTCPRCTDGAERLRTKVAEANRRSRVEL